MKVLTRIGSLLFYIIVIFILVGAVGTAVFKKPILMSAVRSNSMYPLFQKGDMLLVSPTLKNTPISIGDIIIFKTDGGSYDDKGWIVHRIISGNIDKGFITQGDANNYTDQSVNNPTIKREWISGRVMTVGSKPLKLPLVGNLPLLMEKYSKSPFTLPAIALFIGLVIAGSEFFSKEKKTDRKHNLDMQIIYFVSGLTVSILFFGTMLATSQNLKINYGVSEDNKAVLMGSEVGILKLGETITKPLTEINNKGFIPTTAILTCNDKQITLSHEKISLKKGSQVKAEMTVTALTPGKYDSTIHVGLFFPLLPQNILYSLAKTNFWLALVVVSLIPGLPIMLYPLIDPTLRRKTIKQIRRNLRRIKNKLSFGTY